MFLLCFQPLGVSTESPGDNLSTTVDIQKEPSPLTVELIPSDTHGNNSQRMHRCCPLANMTKNMDRGQALGMPK